MSVSDRLGTLPVFSTFVDMSWPWRLAWAWFFTPVAMMFIAPIFESRWLPLGKKQFRGFFPGDLFLGGAFTLLAQSAQRINAEGGDHWWQSDRWHLTCFFGALIGGFLFRSFVDGRNYAPWALWSPTKLYHDFVLYTAYGYLLVSMGIPVMLHAYPKYMGEGLQYYGAFALIIAWAACVVHDMTKRDMREVGRTAHDEHWKFIWAR